MAHLHHINSSRNIKIYTYKPKTQTKWPVISHTHNETSMDTYSTICTVKRTWQRAATSYNCVGSLRRPKMYAFESEHHILSEACIAASVKRFSGHVSQFACSTRYCMGCAHVPTDWDPQWPSGNMFPPTEIHSGRVGTCSHRLRSTVADCGSHSQAVSGISRNFPKY